MLRYPFLYGRCRLHCSSAAACAYDPQSFEQCVPSGTATPHSKPTLFNLSSVSTYRKYAPFYTLIKYKKL